MNTRLNTLYRKKIIAWRDLAGRWDRQECEAQELMEARGAMEILAVEAMPDESWIKHETRHYASEFLIQIQNPR